MTNNGGLGAKDGVEDLLRDTALLKDAARQVLGALVGRGANFAFAEDAVQEALLEATVRWPETGVPAEPAAWLTTVAKRKLVDAQRSEIARRQREEAVAAEPEAGPTETGDDTLLLLFLCCHPALSPTAAVPLTLRAVGGLRTREIAAAYLLPEATIAQRINRAKRVIAEQSLTEPGYLAVVLRVLCLIFNEGYTAGAERVDLAAEAIRLCRLLHATSDEPEVGGLLAMMLLHHARRSARFDGARTPVPLDRQDRTTWDTAMITEGVRGLTAALAQDRRGEYQLQAAIAALHDDSASAAETRLATDPCLVRRLAHTHGQPPRRAHPRYRGRRGRRATRRAGRTQQDRGAARRLPPP